MLGVCLSAVGSSGRYAQVQTPRWCPGLGELILMSHLQARLRQSYQRLRAA